MLPKGFFDQKTAADMMKESEKMQNFQHPHVLNIVGVCVDGGSAPYIIMPFIAKAICLLTSERRRQILWYPKKQMMSWQVVSFPDPPPMKSGIYSTSSVEVQIFCTIFTRPSSLLVVLKGALETRL